MVHCPSRRMPRHIRVLFKYIGGKFEQSSKKRERNNREHGYKSPTVSEKLIAWTIFQHMDFVEEVSMNKFTLKFVFCGFYNHYRNCFEKWQF